MKEKGTTGSLKSGRAKQKADPKVIASIVKSSSGRDTSPYSVKALNAYEKARKEKERMARKSLKK